MRRERRRSGSKAMKFTEISAKNGACRGAGAAKRAEKENMRLALDFWADFVYNDLKKPRSTPPTRIPFALSVHTVREMHHA